MFGRGSEAFAPHSEIDGQQVTAAAASAIDSVRSRRGFLGISSRVALLAVGMVALPNLTGCTDEESSHAGQEHPSAANPSSPGESEADTTLPELDPSKGVDVLKGTWRFMPGADREADGKLRVWHTGLAVLTEGGEGKAPEGKLKDLDDLYVPRSPVNVYGERIDIEGEGNVGFNVRMTDIEGTATFSVMDEPPITRDESVFIKNRVDVTVGDGKVAVTTWDDTGESTKKEISVPEAAREADLAIVQADDGLHITVNGESVCKTNEQLIKKQAWFGLDATDNWRLESLTATPVVGNTITNVNTSTLYDDLRREPGTGSLAGLAGASGHKDKLLGTAVDLTELMANPTYAEFIIKHFNEIQTETMGKLQAWQPEHGKYVWKELDALFDFAEKHDLQVIFHTTVFTEALPLWAVEALRDPNSDKHQLLRDVIKPVIERYGDRMCLVDVVNEPGDPEEWGQINKENAWFKALGPGYIREALKIVKGLKPKLKTSINEWSVESDEDRREFIRSVAKPLADEGLLDIVSMQFHVDEETLTDTEDDVRDVLSVENILNVFREFDIDGLGVRISEASVAENGDPRLQAQIYHNMYEAAFRARNCQGVNLWGALNSKSRNQYFTGSLTPGEKGPGDPGDDAPVTQDERGKLEARAAWNAIKAAAAA